MDIIVTGGAGFIGSHLIDFLMSQGNRVICIDNFSSGVLSNLKKWIDHKSFSLIKADVETVKITVPNVDRIYHLGCPASPKFYTEKPMKVLMTNILGTKNMLETAAKYKCRFLFASTSEVYGDPKESPQSEAYNGNVNTMCARSCYDEGKRVAETLCHIFKGTVDIRIARIFNTYGPRMKFDDGRLVSNFAHQLLCGLPLTIYGQGLQTRSLCYVDDMVEGLYTLMETVGSGLDRPINLGRDEEYRVIDIANIMCELMNKEKNYTYHLLPECDPAVRCPDIKMAKDVLGWESKVDAKSGLMKTIDSFCDITSTKIDDHSKLKIDLMSDCSTIIGS